MAMANANANTMANANANPMANVNTIKIFRYKLSDDIMNSITQFAKIHQFDDRHTYKEAWVDWLRAEEDSVEREVERLRQLDYKGDILDKMFKAGRYYFREKVALDVETKKTEKEKPKRDYIVMHPDIIEAMDNHLRGLIKEKNFKPALAYNQFCNGHVELIRKEIGRLAQNKTINGKELSTKFKKTYKNRYFICSKL
jgi:hypothetical protein